MKNRNKKEKEEKHNEIIKSRQGVGEYSVKFNKKNQH